MLFTVMLTAATQVVGDLACCLLSLYIAVYKGGKHRAFFYINSVAFFAAFFVDTYYNYIYRFLHFDIHSSLNFVVTLPLLIFQLLQAYNWASVINRRFTIYNLPYLFFTILLCSTLIYYFLIGHNPSAVVTYSQSASVGFNMLVWYFAIISLSRARSPSIMFLALGCLLIISADLTFRCLFMLDIDRVATVQWIHILWTLGVLSMLAGFICYLRTAEFKFCPPDSIQASSCAWLSLTSLTVFIIGFILILFSFTYTFVDIQTTLWGLPIALVFTMITAVLLGNWFSNLILLPVASFLKRIELFNSGQLPEPETNSAAKLYEFRLLGDFINSSFIKLSTQLDSEVKLAAQVAHDIRSPLAALQALVEQQLSEIGESKRILLRDAIYHIRDIANNLEKDALPKEKAITQMAILLEHVLSERRVAIGTQSSIRINQNIPIEAYNIFANVVPSEIKRVLTNIINNACEAIKSENGEICVSLEYQGKNTIISVADNGIGISQEKIPSLFDRGVTTKVNGSGLGLFHARESLAQYGGSITLMSELGKGTTVSIMLPLVPPPHWYISRLSILADSPLICVDDSISIWHAWQERLKQIDKFDLKYCSSKEDLQEEVKKQKKTPCTYLVDYEFSGRLYTGLDLVDIILSLNNPDNRIFLVTSRSGEVELQKFCESKGIFIIPKFFALKIPLEVFKSPAKTVVVSSTLSSQYSAESTVSKNDAVVLYENINDLFANLALFSKDCKIFVHKSLLTSFYSEKTKNHGLQVIPFEDLNKLLNELNSVE